MADKTLKDVAELMAKIDFCMMETHSEDGRIAARPMSSNGDVEYRGQSWFYSYEDSRKIRDLRSDNRVGLSFQGSSGVMGLLGKPGVMIANVASSPLHFSSNTPASCKAITRAIERCGTAA